MKTLFRLAQTCVLLVSGFCLGIVQAQVPVAVEKVTVVGSEQGIGVQITANRPLATEAQMLSGPDRLVIDFPGAVPGTGLRGLRLNQGEIKAVRAALWSSKPPVTRVVIDLEGPTSYSLIPAGQSINVKFGAAPKQLASHTLSGPTVEQPLSGVTKSRTAPPTMADLARPALRVGFDRGLLTISASKATLADVLYQVHLTTGANIPIPAGAEEESVAIQVGPGPAKDVMAALLNGSRFNYVLQGTAKDPQSLGTLLLTPKANVGAESADTPPPALPSSPAIEQGQVAAPVAPANPPLDPVQQLGLNPEFTPNPEPPDEQ